MKHIALAIVCILITTLSSAQSKVGTIDSEFILSKLPELTKVQEDLKAYNTKLETDLKAKVEDYQSKVKTYQEGAATMTDALKKTKQEAIITLENEINQFRQNAAQLVQIEQNRLLQPLYKKIGIALEAVAKSEGYTQVLTLTSSGIAYIDPAFDLTKTVMAKLGISVE